MAVRNNFSVLIEHSTQRGRMIYYTKKAVFPLKFANLLDERLDECYLSLRHMQRKEFKPLTRVEIIIHNQMYFGFGENENVIRSQDKTLKYFVANDQAEESPVGSGLWNHDLYLIEPTKYLEMYIVESLTWRNVLGRHYDINSIAPYTFTGTGAGASLDEDRVKLFANSFKEMSVYGAGYDFVAPYDLFNQIYDNNRPDAYAYRVTNELGITVRNRGQVVFEYNLSSISGLGQQARTVASGQVGDYTVNKVNQEYPPIIDSAQEAAWNDLNSRFVPRMGETYEVAYTHKVDAPTALQEFIKTRSTTTVYSFAVVANQYPLKRFTITDVINRLLDLAEPLRLGETPRFKLNAEQAKQFDQIYAPEFSMTRNTLRECLKEVGAFIHGEPRLILNDDGTNEIRYDMYGGTKKAVISRTANIFKSSAQKIENYCTSIDSSASNLINQTDWAAGVIFEPNMKDYRTVRTETQYTRISDSNMLISTNRPIYAIQKVEYLGSVISGVVNPQLAPKAVDITPYVVESTVYNSQLSSYSEQYPYSKAYGIYYTQGEQDIKGLNFRVEQPTTTGSVWESYAIINILKRACAEAGVPFTPPGTDDPNYYPQLAFRVTYLPIFDVRVAQSKSYYKDHDKHAALIYNQAATTIESTYYGENLKGVVARLGNPEVGVTYILSRLTQIPKAGELYDEDHYISAVSVEILPTHIKCTIGLSKDFNRLSEYIGVDSTKRQWEVSERQTYDRATLYHEYIVVGDDRQSDDSTLIGSSFMDAVADTFAQSGNYVPLTSVIAWGGTYDNPVSVTENGETVSPLPCVELPVLSTALGNSMAFIWNYKDNYSAGSVSTYQTVGQVSGYWQGDYQYTDYYGRMWYYNFDVIAPVPNDDGTGTTVDYLNLKTRALSLPKASFPTERSKFISTGTKPYQYRKDSAEVPQFNMQVEFVTNRKELIIGSALASACGLVRGTAPKIDNKPARAYVYVFPFNINKFVRDIGDIPELAVNDYFLNSIPFEIIYDAAADRFKLAFDNLTQDNLSYKELETIRNYATAKSWVIITPMSVRTETVEDEQGKVIEQTYSTGGEVLLACNGEFHVGDNIGDIWFTPVHELYER